MRKTPTLTYKYPTVTKGEDAYLFVRNHLNVDGTLHSTTTWMTQFDRSELWSSYVEEFMSLTLTGRLIASGRCLQSKYNNSTVFRNEYNGILSELLPLNRTEQERLLRLSTAAVDASLEKISHGTRRALTSWAQTQHPFCYLCGLSLDFTQADTDSSFTIDHIWPQDYGGDSDIDNLLPACRDCNNNHKKNYPTWAMTNIHSLLLGLEPSENSLGRVQGASRFAIHHRYVQTVAVRDRKTLKEAYLCIGPSEAVRVIDRLEFAHFFNLANHSSSGM